MATHIKASELISVCIQLAQTAGDLARNTYETGTLNTEMKGENDPVTQADKDSQILIEATLYKLYPNLKVIGEEDVSL
jgi:3'(2'), 5'-bisphosphate nucleotidase